MKHATAMALLSIGLTVPCLALAQSQPAYTAKDAHVRAGPDRDYPIVAVLPGGYPLEVQGCLSDYSWCDVVAGPSRGWVFAGNIAYAYQGANVPLLDYGPALGIGVLGFFAADYWGNYYRDRAFYRDRSRYFNRPAPPRRDWRPPQHGLPNRGDFSPNPHQFPLQNRPDFGPGRPGFEHRPGSPEGRPQPQGPAVIGPQPMPRQQSVHPAQPQGAPRQARPAMVTGPQQSGPATVIGPKAAAPVQRAAPQAAPRPNNPHQNPEHRN